MAYLAVDFSSGYASPYYSGGGLADAALVPGLYPVAINGHPYILNTDPNAIEVYGNTFKEESLPLLRQQADQGRTAGEQTLSPSQFWRRSADTWHAGAGQSVYDREISDPNRFNTSKGINPWEKYQLTLHNDTSNIRASVNTNLVGIAANSAFYVADGNNLVRTTDLSSFTTCTGLPAAQASSLATNGSLVYASYGASGIYSISGTTGALLATGTSGIVGFAKGRLLTANGGALSNYLTGGAIPAAIWTVPDAGWTFTAFAETEAFIYAAGFVGDRSRIYRIAVQPDGTALTAGVVAATLPTGETVRSMIGYLGFIIIGTSRGVRFATASATGDLTLGSVIPTSGAVYTLDADDRFVWFGWTNYDTVSSGLGRLDLQTINDGLTPAYATDLMATGQGAVHGTGLVGDLRAFTVDGVGIFAELADTPVASGDLTTGQINYGISDAKVTSGVSLKHAPMPIGSDILVSMSSERGAPDILGASDIVASVSPVEPISTAGRRAEEVELTFTLRSDPDTPTLTRWTLLAYPAPEGASVYSLPLWLKPDLVTLRDTEESMDTLREYLFLRGLHDSREIVTVQIGSTTFEGTLEDYVWVPERHLPDHSYWSGTLIAKIRRLVG